MKGNKIFDPQQILETLKGSVNGIIDQAVGIIPDLLSALIILIVGYFIAKAIQEAVRHVFRVIGFDTIADKLELDRLMDKAQVKMSPSGLLAKIIYYVVFLAFLTAALEKLGMEVINDMIGSLISYIPRLFAAVIILFLGGFIAKILADLTKGAASAADLSYGKMLARIVHTVAMIFVFVITLGQIGVDTTLFTTNITGVITGIIFAVALATGLGNKTLMGNIVSAQTLKDKIEVGDTISCGDCKGVVKRVDMTGVMVATEGMTEHVPASKLTENGYKISK